MKVIGIAGPSFAYRLSSTSLWVQSSQVLRRGLVAFLIRLEANSLMHTRQAEVLLFKSGFLLKCSNERESLCSSQKQS